MVQAGLEASGAWEDGAGKARHTQKRGYIHNTLGISEEAAQDLAQPQGFDP